MKEMFMWRILLASVLGFGASAYGADSANINLICISEKATGFKYNKDTDEWNISNFNVETSKYIFSKYAGDLEGYKGKYSFTTLGEDFPQAVCLTINEYGFGEDCSGFHDLLINVDTLRFQVVYPTGYVLSQSAIDDGTQEGNTPSMEIGKCSKF
jgi:hypothetical protein